jgi:hypothetical protein
MDDSAAMSALGCSRAQAALANQDIVVILDFFYPYTGGDGKHPDDGVILDDGSYHYLGDVEDAVDDFIQGFMAPSCYVSGSHLTVVMGVNNSNYQGGDYVTEEHGTEWAQTVNDVLWNVGTWGWATQVTVWGGIDAEMAYNSGQATLAWALGFSEAESSEWYLDFGTCEDCLTQCTSPGQSLASTPYPWTCQQIYDVARGEPSNPTASRAMPEIYNTGGYNATEWYNLSLFGHEHYTYATPTDPYVDGAIRFSGALTQWNACQEDQGTLQQCDPSVENDPNTGFDQLYSALLADPRTDPQNSPYPFMVWSSDMSWEK